MSAHKKYFCGEIKKYEHFLVKKMPYFELCITCLFLIIVHLRMRPLDQANPKTLFPSSSAVTYWQIELQEGVVAGKHAGKKFCRQHFEIFLFYFPQKAGFDISCKLSP